MHARGTLHARTKLFDNVVRRYLSGDRTTITSCRSVVFQTSINLDLISISLHDGGPRDVFAVPSKR